MKTLLAAFRHGAKKLAAHTEGVEPHRGGRLRASLLHQLQRNPDAVALASRSARDTAARAVRGSPATPELSRRQVSSLATLWYWCAATALQEPGKLDRLREFFRSAERELASHSCRRRIDHLFRVFCDAASSIFARYRTRSSDA